MKYKFIIITINPDYKPPTQFLPQNTIIFRGTSYKEEPDKIKAFFKNDKQDIRKLATLYSHIHAIKYASEQPFTKTHQVIIMEDDIEPNNLCPKSFKRILKQNKKPEIVQLSIMTQLHSPFWLSQKPKRQWRRNFWSACAYRISYAGMQKVLQHIQNNQMDISRFKSKVADFIIFAICKTITPQLIPFTYNMRPTTIGNPDRFAFETKLNLKLHSLLNNPKFYKYCKENNFNSIYTPHQHGHILKIVSSNAKLPITLSQSSIILFPTIQFVNQNKSKNYSIFYVDNELDYFTEELLSYKHIFANNYNYTSNNYDKIPNNKKLFINFK